MSLATEFRRVAAAAIALALGACATPKDPREQQETLFAAERAFAQQSVREGMRAAFAANFAEDGVVFWPAPVRLHQALATQPASPNPLATTLDWLPAAGGVARDDQLGWTTGPWVRTDNVGGTPARHGLFFSVWRKRDDRWQVVADAGAQLAAPVAPDVVVPGPRPGPGGTADPAALTAQERLVTTRQTYANRFADDAMLASDATGVLRSSGIAARWRGDLAPFALEPAFAYVTTSGDMGYSYGAFATAGRTGHYLHLWTRDRGGAWRIAVATLQGPE